MKYGVVGLLCVVCVAACWPTKQDPNACDTDVGCVSGTCNLKTHECEGATDAHVGDDGTEHHDLAGTCTKNSECTSDPTKPMCDTTTSECVSCSADMGVCSGNTPVCGPTGACVQCLHQTDCANGQACNMTTNTCVACAKNSDCDVTGICDTTTTPGTSTCAASANIIYVDNVACTAQTPDGSATAPFCQVDANTFAKVDSTRKYIKVAGSATAYSAIAVPTDTSVDVVIVGPGKTPASGSTAQFGGMGAALVVAPSTLFSSTVTVDGLELIGSMLSGGKAGVLCSGSGGTAANLTIRDCYIHGSGAEGVSSTACTLDLERNIIQNNVGGIAITGGTFAIQDNFIVKNSSTTQPGVSFDNSSSGTFDYNTVANNMTSTTNVAGGVSCGTAGKMLSASIIYGNTKNPTSQLDGSCTLSNVVTGADSAQMSDTYTPAFVSPSDLHLTNVAANTACCIDKIALGTKNQPALDIDSEPRPMGAGFDVGADEVKP